MSAALGEAVTVLPGLREVEAGKYEGLPEADAADEEQHDRVLWVSLRHRPMAPLGDVSFLLRQLRNKRTVRPRLVFPGELREAIGAALEPLLALTGLPVSGPGP